MVAIGNIAVSSRYQNFIKVSNVEEKDRSLWLFGAFIRMEERYWKKEHDRIWSIRVKHANTVCYECKSQNTYISKMGNPRWYLNKEAEGTYLCSKCSRGGSKNGMYGVDRRGHGKGHRLPFESRKKIAEKASKRRKYFDGFNIVDAIRDSRLYREWREKCLCRDGFRCVDCGRTGQLEVHHVNRLSEIIKLYGIKTLIDAYNCNYIWDTRNGETLCVTCHKTKYSRIRNFLYNLLL